MAPRHYKAFTLVEMLVVIVIISMLVALLLPAVVGARARARQASCLNNQGQVAKAIAQYESAKQAFPGYVNQTGKTGTTRLGLDAGKSLSNVANLSWVAMILEPLGRADLWKEWRVSTGARPEVALSEVVCPSDTLKVGKPGALSLVVNCGISDYYDDGSAYHDDADKYKQFNANLDLYDTGFGLFFNHDATRLRTGTKSSTIGADGIADGASQTIMLSENLQAFKWSVGSGTSGAILQSDVGMVWWSTASSTFPWTADTNFQEAMLVNGTPLAAPSSNRAFLRPSSNHAGGANIIYADGRGDFISDRTEYTVLRDQLISDQSRARKAGLVP